VRAETTTCFAVAVAALLSASSAGGGELRDLHFGEALYHAYQGHFFEALQRLDSEIAQHYGVDEPELDSLDHHIDHAEFSVGDFELNYRMHHRAGRAIKAVLEADVEDPVRNEAALRLARIHFQKGRPEDALLALEGISGRVPDEIQDDVEFLRANVYLAVGRAEDAVDVLRRLQGAEELRGFSAYNLGIALLQDGRDREAIQQLDRAGRLAAGDQATLAIRDKSNLVLGTLLFESSEFGPAQRSLDRVRLAGPFSNQALLRAGWADASAEKFERALVPWSILAEREATDAAVQEAMLALPYAYSRLDVHGRAALLYGRAVESFGEELSRVDASITSIESGEFLKALVREEIRQDKDWVIRLRRLPESPETFYLMALMASHDFQTALQNYLDLEDLRKKLVSWQKGFDAFDDIIRLRREYYEPRLPEIDGRFRKLDAQMRLRLEQRESLARRLDHMLIAPRPDHLATAEEQHLAARLERLEARAHGGRAAIGRGFPGGRAAGEDPAPRGCDHLESRDPIPRAADGGPQKPARAEPARGRVEGAVRSLRPDAAGGDPQLRRLRAPDRRSPGPRGGCAGAARRAHGPAGSHAGDGRGRRAQGAPGAIGGLPEPGTFRVCRQLRPRREDAGPLRSGERCAACLQPCSLHRSC
jgi:tetratricopeptide (TPR) repeat protein